MSEEARMAQDKAGKARSTTSRDPLPDGHERRSIVAHKDDWPRIKFVVERLAKVRAEG